MNVGRACRILCAALAASLSTLSGLRVALAQQPVQATQPPAGSIPQANSGARADVLAAKDQSKTASGPSAVEQFKQFLASPPIIQNLVFQQKVPMGGGMRPLDGSFAFSTSWEYFQAKWQTNGLFFRRLNGPSDVTNFAVAGELVSWSGHEHALVEPTRQITTWDDRDPTVAGKRISVFYTSQFFLDPLKEILNLGIMHAEIGSTRWEGNRFESQRELDEQPLVITGEVFPGSNGPPRAMKVCYRLPHLTNSYVIRYGYDPPLRHPFIPTVMTNLWLSGGSGEVTNEIELNQWRILDFETAEAPLAPEAFSVAPFARRNAWASRVYTNGAIYYVATNGELRLAYPLNPSGMRPTLPPSRTALAAFYTCWGALNVTLFALMVGAKERNQEQIKQERTDTR